MISKHAAYTRYSFTHQNKQFFFLLFLFLCYLPSDKVVRKNDDDDARNASALITNNFLIKWNTVFSANKKNMIKTVLLLLMQLIIVGSYVDHANSDRLGRIGKMQPIFFSIVRS